MEIKSLEIRDRATFIPALAIRFGARDERDRFLLARAGFGNMPIGEPPPPELTYIVLIRLTDMEANYDVHRWRKGSARTMPIAHEYLTVNWDAVENGQVLDVECILGETQRSKLSEAVTHGR